MNKVGLILEGGGMRGVYTAGVLDAFLEYDLNFDGCIGVSAGCCHAASFLSRQKGRAYRTNVNYLNDWRYCSFRSWITTGNFFGPDMLYRIIPDELDPYDKEAFEKNPCWYRGVITNIETGEAEYPQFKDMATDKDVIYMQASASLPLLSKTVIINGKKYLDGGISDSIPITKMIELGCEKNVVILTQSRDYQKKPASTLPLFKIFYHRYPRLIEAMASRHTRYNKTLEMLHELEKAGKIIILQPAKPVKIGRIEKNKEKLHELYKLGYQDGKKAIEQIKSFIK